MAFIPFIPLVIGAAMQSARGIIQNRQNRKTYDAQVAKQTAAWEAAERARVQRAGIIQRLIDSDPKLKEAAQFLGPDFWSNVMTAQPIPKNYFPDRPRGGFMGDFIAGHVGGLGTGQGDITSAFNASRDANSYPDVSSLLKPPTAQMDGGGGGAAPYKAPDWEGDEFTASPGTSTQGGGYGSNVPKPTAPSASSLGAPKPVSTQGTNNPALPTPPSVLDGMGLHFDPETGQITNKFGGQVEF